MILDRYSAMPEKRVKGDRLCLRHLPVGEYIGDMRGQMRQKLLQQIRTAVDDEGLQAVACPQPLKPSLRGLR